MLSGVGIMCFAASYSVALVLELTRLLFRSGVRGAVMLGFAGAGLVAHSAFLYYRAVDAVGSPLSSERDWYLLAAWALVVAYLYLVYYHPRVPFGLFLLPLVLVLIAAATWYASPAPFARGPASKVWGVVHGVSIVLATVSVFLGFAAGLMYLGQARQLKRKRIANARLRLPSLEWLQQTNRRAIVVAVPMLGTGVISGMVLSVLHARAEAASVAWHDPLVLSTSLMFAWLLITAIVGAVYRPVREGRKVAYLTVVSFVFLAIVLGIGLFGNTRHWQEPSKEGTRKEKSGRSYVEIPASEGSGTRFRHSGLGVRGCGLGIGDWGFGARDWGLGIQVRRFRISHSLLSAHYPLPTTHCPLPSAFCLLSSPSGGPA